MEPLSFADDFAKMIKGNEFTNVNYTDHGLWKCAFKKIQRVSKDQIVRMCSTAMSAADFADYPVD